MEFTQKIVGDRLIITAIQKVAFRFRDDELIMYVDGFAVASARINERGDMEINGKVVSREWLEEQRKGAA